MRLGVFLSHHQSRTLFSPVCTNQRKSICLRLAPNQSHIPSLQMAWQSPFPGAQLPGSRAGNVCSAQSRDADSILVSPWAQLSQLTVLSLDREAWYACPPSRNKKRELSMFWKPSLLEVLMDRETQPWVEVGTCLPSIPLLGNRCS